MVRLRPLPPSKSGIGLRTGVGLVFRHSSRIVLMPASSLSNRSFSVKNGMSKTRCSFWFHPAPTPSSKRPPESESTDAASLASTPGSRNVMGVTIGPNSIVFVHSAANASDSQHSMQSRSPVFVPIRETR